MEQKNIDATYNVVSQQQQAFKEFKQGKNQVRSYSGWPASRGLSKILDTNTWVAAAARGAGREIPAPTLCK